MRRWSGTVIEDQATLDSAGIGETSNRFAAWVWGDDEGRWYNILTEDGVCKI
jgi:hypothetical protein